MTGTVTDEGVPIIMLPVAGQMWPGIIDTGFNGDVEIPEALRESLNARFIGRISSLLASGQHIEQDVYLVTFPLMVRRFARKRPSCPAMRCSLGRN